MKRHERVQHTKKETKRLVGLMIGDFISGKVKKIKMKFSGPGKRLDISTTYRDTIPGVNEEVTYYEMIDKIDVI